MQTLHHGQKGFTILELLIALAIAALLLTALTGVVGGALNLRDDTQARVDGNTRSALCDGSHGARYAPQRASTGTACR